MMKDSLKGFTHADRWSVFRQQQQAAIARLKIVLHATEEWRAHQCALRLIDSVRNVENRKLRLHPKQDSIPLSRQFSLLFQALYQSSSYHAARLNETNNI